MITPIINEEEEEQKEVEDTKIVKVLKICLNLVNNMEKIKKIILRDYNAYGNEWSHLCALEYLIVFLVFYTISIM